MQMEKHFILCKVLSYSPLQTTSDCMKGRRHIPKTQVVFTILVLVSGSLITE